MIKPMKAFLIIIAAMTVAAAGPGWAQRAAGPDYPSKPIRLIDPFPPGGGTSTVAHMIGQRFLERWGHAVVVDSRGGAGGAIGTDIAAHAAPDGYTLVMATASTVVINPLFNKVPFDPLKDFDPVIHTATIPLILLIHPAVQAKSVRDLIGLAKTQPGKINFASSGEGTISHLAGELFKVSTGVNMVHIPYRGGGPARNALIGGHVQVNFGNMLSAASHVTAGQLRALAVTTSKRAGAMPDVPTVAEAGVPGYEVVQWSGILAPDGTPKAIIAKLNREINQILTLPEVKKYFFNGGSEPAGGTSQELAAFLKAEIAKWSRVIKEAGIRVNR